MLLRANRWLLAPLMLLTVACGSRTGLAVGEPMDAGPWDAGPRDAGFDAGPVDSCVPRPEICNGLDEDCDGVADDGIACFWLDGEPVTALETTTCGVEWYGYDAPDPQSANPNPDIRIRDAVVVAVQYGASCPGASIALIADLALDGTGGELQTSFSVSPPDAAGLLVSDEDHECTFDTDSGTGVCEFVWVGCCTDGLLIGPIMRSGCVRLDIGSPVGVDALIFIDGSGRQSAGDFGESMEICVQILPDA